jgi:GT2 family glycosyltransferase
MIKTAIVILNWNGRTFLEKFLPSVLANTLTPDSAIYVADNGSTDDSVALLKEKFPAVKIILLDKNYGFAGGYNKALQQIEAKYYVLLNSDVEVTPNWLRPMEELMDNSEKTAACMPKLKDFYNRQYFEYAGAAGGFIDKFGYPFCRGRIIADVEKDEGQYDTKSEIFWATGACFLIRADLYQKSGGLDEDFFAHMEEIDLCWRLKNMGYNIYFTPESTVYHVGGGTLPPSNPFKTYLNFRNNLYMLYKNIPEQWLALFIARRITLDWASAFKYLLSFMFKEAWAIFHAHWSFFSRIGSLSIKRKEIENFATLSLHPQMINKSIVYYYFIKKKRKFSELLPSSKQS